MIQEKTQKKVLKVIAALKSGRNLSEALKSGKMTRGHYYSARDGMIRDGHPVVKQFCEIKESVGKKAESKVSDAADRLNQEAIRNADKLAGLHEQALRENDRLKWAEELIEEIKGTQKRQTEILKKLVA